MLTRTVKRSHGYPYCESWIILLFVGKCKKTERDHLYPGVHLSAHQKFVDVFFSNPSESIKTALEEYAAFRAYC